MSDRVEVLVIGSGAGGATTALTLAERGHKVLVVEDGPRPSLDAYGASAAEAMPRIYRARGMTPIMGRVPIGYVEGRCVGGSTEINSGFWHRSAARDAAALAGAVRPRRRVRRGAAPHFEWAEGLLGVGLHAAPWPPSTTVFVRGAERMGWSRQETPRAARGCRSTNACASGCPTGAKQGMSRSLIPAAEAAGARVLPECRVRLLLEHKGRITGVLAEQRRPDGASDLVRIDADHVMVCCGPTETPALLRRSGIRLHVGESLRIHPMLKVVARFPEIIDAHRSVLPLIQVKEFGPEITPRRRLLHERPPRARDERELEHGPRRDGRLAPHGHLLRGGARRGTGSVRSSFWGEHTLIAHELDDEDVWNLSKGLARCRCCSSRAGAEEVHPGVFGLPRHAAPTREAVKWLDDRLPREALSLTTVHAFSSCPMGERRDRCAADSYGRVYGRDNLYVNDSSMLPDSPGVNPQGTIMALARRNALAFHDRGQA
jgi:choline dehydrogenase-like flavoprotein